MYGTGMYVCLCVCLLVCTCMFVCLFVDVKQGSAYSTASVFSLDLNEASPSCVLEVWRHMYGTSMFVCLFVDVKQGSAYSTASVFSPDLNEASPSCNLEVWRHMYGTGMFVCLFVCLWMSKRDLHTAQLQSSPLISTKQAHLMLPRNIALFSL